MLMTSAIRNALAAFFAAVTFGVVTNATADVNVDANGNLGVGTDVPDGTVHVTKGDGTTKLKIQETLGGTVPNTQVLLDLSYKKFPLFTFAETEGNNFWTFRLSGRGGSAFEATKLGTGDAEFFVTQDGDGTFRGAVNATGFNTVSSRASKRKFSDVDESQVLATLATLPISTWEYKKSGDSAGRHIGPVAEDFYGAFGFGNDDKHISPNNMAGVALVSVKELHRENQELKAENDTLGKKVEKLHTELEELKALVKSIKTD